MTFDVRLLVISLATFVVAGLAGSLAVPWLAGRCSTKTPTAWASGLFKTRLFPIILASLATAQGIASFVLFEPRNEDEIFGRVLLGLAAAAAGLMLLAAVRLFRAWLSTKRALDHWMTTAEPIALAGVRVPAFAIDSQFPVVAVVGIFRPRLVIARSVLEACPADELQAILAHERHHIASRDNVRRAVLVSLPDPIALLPAGHRLNTMWHDAAETAADDSVTQLGALGRLNLASALLRVARLAPAGQPAIDLPASALYRGENIDGRVRRLLADSPEPVGDGLSRLQRFAVSAALVGACALALHGMHELVEIAVSVLP